jgi:hypothetical protein
MVAAIAEFFPIFASSLSIYSLYRPPAPRKDMVRGIITTAASEWPKIENDPDAVKFENVTSNF